MQALAKVHEFTQAYANDISLSWPMFLNANNIVSQDLKAFCSNVCVTIVFRHHESQSFVAEQQKRLRKHGHAWSHEHTIVEVEFHLKQQTSAAYSQYVKLANLGFSSAQSIALPSSDDIFVTTPKSSLSNTLFSPTQHNVDTCTSMSSALSPSQTQTPSASSFTTFLPPTPGTFNGTNPSLREPLATRRHMCPFDEVHQSLGGLDTAYGDSRTSAAVSNFTSSFGPSFGAAHKGGALVE